MGLIDFAADWLQWWTWEMRGILGPRLRGVPRAAPAVVHIDRSGVRVEAAGQPGPVTGPVTVADAFAGEAVLSEAPAARQSGVDLVIGPGRYLARPLAALRLPRSRALAMAELDLAGATPFRREECALLLPEYRDAPETRYFVVRRSHVEPALDSLRASGLVIRRLHLADDGDLVALDAPSRRALLGTRPGLVGRGTRWAGATAAIGIVLLLGVAHWRYQTALSAIDRRIAASEADAAAVRKVVHEREQLVAQVAAARSAKSEAVPLVRILEEMARTIPDETWLTDLDFAGTTVTFSGMSAAAPALIPALDASPLFVGPTFSQPVVRVPEQSRDRFTVTMTLESADG